MTKRIIAATFAIAAAGAVMAGTANAATPVTAASGQTTITHADPWHDPHCTRDGRWHNDQNDRGGRPDGRCPRW